MQSFNLRGTLAIAAVAILLLVEFTQFHEFFYPFQLLWQQSNIIEFILSLLLFFLNLLSTFLVFFSAPSFARRITLPLFLFFVLFNMGSYQVSNAPIDFQQAQLIVNYFQWWLGSVLENIGVAVLPLLIMFIPTVILVERLPNFTKLNVHPKAYYIPLGTVILTSIGLHYSDGKFDRYPSLFRIPSMLVFASGSHTYAGERSSVAYSGTIAPHVEKIVLIVDESIRADILGINGYNKETTPYLSSLQSGVVNLGLAAAASNCSNYSNLVLRTGLKKNQIPDSEQVSLKQASIWQFTRKAGFYNVYLDAQSKSEWANYQNFMNSREAVFIDKLLRVRQPTAYESDDIALEQLQQYLRTPGRTFIMLNKYGIHFPYSRSYPKEYNLFTPALQLGEPMNDRGKSLNSYMNGIRWSVDEWFKKLLSASSDFQPYIIIYTSDHGQNIVDDGSLATHCRPRANRFEGIVPMMVFSNDAEILQKFKTGLANNFNHTNHFQIFPTLLSLAGYEQLWSSRHYGESLTEPSHTKPEFFVGDLHGRGSVRHWVSILPAASQAN